MLAVAVAIALTSAACAKPSPQSLGSVPRSEATTIAVYLGPQAGGHLTSEDLAANPGVKVVHDWKSFQSAASTRTALWIDSDFTPMVDWRWVSERGWHDLCPVAIIGQDDEAGYHNKLQLWGEYGNVAVKPGFVIWVVAPREPVGGYFFRGYEETPTVEAISGFTSEALKSWK